MSLQVLLLKYFQQKELSDPNGLLSNSVPSRMVGSANREVQEELKRTKYPKKRGPYVK